MKLLRVSLNNLKFLVIIFLPMLLSCKLLDAALEAPKDCRDDMIRKVPIYPDAQFVREETNSSSEDLNWGSFTRIYETPDSINDIFHFYTPLVGCWSNSFKCGGFADDDNRIFYLVKIIDSNEMTTTFSIDFDWMCTRGQFSSP